jgi:hypothetical protein
MNLMAEVDKHEDQSDGSDGYHSRVRFKAGTSSTIKGSIEGDDFVICTLKGESSQVMSILFSSSNASCFSVAHLLHSANTGSRIYLILGKGARGCENGPDREADGFEQRLFQICIASIFPVGIPPILNVAPSVRR